MSAPQIEFVDEQQTSRLVSSAYIDEPAIAPLFDSPDEKAALEKLEARTSSRLTAEHGGSDEMPSGLFLTQAFGYGWSFVNAAFAYTRAGGNRFNTELRGAWYAALAVETCLNEVAFHLGRELENTGETQNVTKYVEMRAHIQGPMATLMNARDSQCLHPDIAIGYPAGQAFAKTVLAQNLSGIKYPSVRDEKGICIAALIPQIIKRVTRGKSFLLVWDGGGAPQISEL